MGWGDALRRRITRRRKPTGYRASSGQLARGNIDLSTRPRVRNPDGSTSTVRSIGVEQDSHHFNIPTVSNRGHIMSDDEAVSQFRSSQRHLGKYRTREQAERAAKVLHENEAKKISPQRRAALQRRQMKRRRK